MNTRISVGDPLAAASNPFLRVHLGYFGLVLNRLDERCGQCHQLDCSHIRPGQASRTVPAGILFFVPVPEVKRRGRKRVFSTAFPLALIDDGRVTVRVFTLPNTGDSMRLLTVPLGILKAFSARNIRIAEDILDFFFGDCTALYRRRWQPHAGIYD